MSRVTAPVGDLGPEFARRVAREIDRAAARFMRIGRTADRFERADLIQAECNRLAGLPTKELTDAYR